MYAPLDLPQVSAEDRNTLEMLVRSRKTEQRIALRARIVLAAAKKQTTSHTARDLGISRPTVLQWRHRFAKDGLKALLKDAPRSGRPRVIDTAAVGRIIDATLHTKPTTATHWSTREMARAQGVSPATVQRIWSAHGIKPHLVRTFKLSNDPRFVEKLRDVVGLYLNPPEHAVVFSVDEKSQIQALDRTQASLPMKKGRAGTMTHDYKRNGTTTLFAALNVLDGTVIRQCMPRHRHQEFLKFLKRIDAAVPKALDVHLIVDNYATHKKDEVRNWLARHPRFAFHFVPTSSSWLNLVERWFREITSRRIRRGIFRNVDELVGAIYEYVDEHNKNPKPFV
ncbi:MAG: IS630 family transposase, partial [Actinomycetota bacterium]